MDTVEFINMLCGFDCKVEFGNLNGEFAIIIKIDDNINKGDLYDIIEFIEEHSDVSDIRVVINGCISVVR